MRYKREYKEDKIYGEFIAYDENGLVTFQSYEDQEIYYNWDF